MGDDGEEDVYLVRREAGDDAVPVARSRLRHRVIVKQCHARNCEFCTETSGITETKRTPIRDHRDTTNEEPHTVCLSET